MMERGLVVANGMEYLLVNIVIIITSNHLILSFLLLLFAPFCFFYLS